MNRLFNLLTVLFLFFSISSCEQERNNQSKSDSTVVPNVVDYHFLKYIDTVVIHGDTTGIISLDIAYSKLGKEESNPYGEAQIFMIHKNGGKWWFEQAKKKFPTYKGNPNPYPEDDAVAALFKADSSTIEDYDKWVFFIDKKYLSPGIIEDGDFDPKDPENKKSKWQPYYISEDSPPSMWEEILYEQKHEQKNWTETGKMIIDTKNNTKKILTENGLWEVYFVRQKLIHLNEDYNKK